MDATVQTLRSGSYISGELFEAVLERNVDNVNVNDDTEDIFHEADRTFEYVQAFHDEPEPEATYDEFEAMFDLTDVTMQGNVDHLVVTDDYRALPELQELVDAEVVLSPIVLRALVQRDALGEEEAEVAFEAIAESRDWLGAPIYRYAR